MIDVFQYAPIGYVCPLCLTANGVENDNTLAKLNDVFYRDNLVFAMVNSKFVGNNPGHVIIVPNMHYESIFDIPSLVAHRVTDVSKQVAIAMKETRNCDSIMIRQNNGPASGQHAFHFHTHVFPRFIDDRLETHMADSKLAEPAERLIYADALRSYFQIQPIVIENL